MVRNTMSDSPGYTLALGYVQKILNRLDRNRCSPRQFSLHGIQRAANIPLTAEGALEARELATKVLEDLQKEGRIVTFRIGPKFDGGPEWAFFTLPRRSKKTEAVNDGNITGTPLRSHP